MDSLRGLFITNSKCIQFMHLYFVVFKDKKKEDYKLFSNNLFDEENKAEHFGKSSMKRGFEHKVLEYNNENYDMYWRER